MIEWFLDLLSSKKSIHQLSRWLDVPAAELNSPNLDYRTIPINKKSGKKRWLSIPNDSLKILQRRTLRRLLKNLKTHPLATGFQPGVSFIENARCHQSQEIVVKVDIVDFFPSITAEKIYEYFRFIGWNRQCSRLLTNLTTYNGSLPQGAPTSPRLSNLVNYRFDHRLAKLAESRQAVFTRYADDITFSLSTADADVNLLVRTILQIIRSEGYRPHTKKKLSIRRAHQRQVVTGLVVNQNANFSREKRRWLRAVKHRSKLSKKGGYLGPRPTLTGEQIQGWESLQNHIDLSKSD